jgi:hypothetical protein
MPGLSYQSNGQTKHNPIALGALWARDRIFHSRNEALTAALENQFVVSYETVRGCRNRCIYCQYNDSPFQMLDMDIVEKELEFLCGFQIPHMRICDAYFGGTQQRAKHILNILGRVNRETSVKVYPDLSHVDAEYVTLAKHANVEITSIGIQTTNDSSLRRIGRPAVHRCSDAIAILLKHFPETPADVILGLPDDDIPGVKKTFRDILTHGFSSVNVHWLAAFPGTILTENLPSYLGGAFSCGGNGQILSSSAFPVESRQRLSTLVHALHIALVLKKTRGCLRVDGNDNILDIADLLNDDTILDIYDILHSNRPVITLQKLEFIVGKLHIISRGKQEIRDAIAYDLLYHAFRISSRYNIKRLKWMLDNKIRLISRIYCMLPSTGMIFWNLDAQTFAMDSSIPKADLDNRRQSLFIDSNNFSIRGW